MTNTITIFDADGRAALAAWQRYDACECHYESGGDCPDCLAALWDANDALFRWAMRVSLIGLEVRRDTNRGDDLEGRIVQVVPWENEFDGDYDAEFAAYLDKLLPSRRVRSKVRKDWDLGLVFDEDHRVYDPRSLRGALEDGWLQEPGEVELERWPGLITIHALRGRSSVQ